MIVRALATTEQCRDGNCPTAWLTDRGTVVVQGYASTADVVGLELPEGVGAVEVPERILMGTADALAPATSTPAVIRSVPGQRGTAPAAWPTDRGTFVVRGDVTSVDVVGLEVPEGEGAVEVPGHVVVGAAATVESRLEEAV